MHNLFKATKFKPTNSIGIRGESAAIIYLKRSGYKVLERNYCNTSGRRLGEIDIIAKDANEIVFIEVKTRKINNQFTQSFPRENITRSKLHKLSKIAAYYLFQNKLQDEPYRFDAIEILADLENNKAQVIHLKNIFL